MAEAGKNSSGSDSDTQTQSNVTVSVNKERGLDVELLLKIRGLKPRSGLRIFFSGFAKQDDPEFLCANAEFPKWQLTATSLAFTARVSTEKKRKRKKPQQAEPCCAADSALSSPDDMNIEVFEYKIRRFPTNINPETAKFEVLQPSGRPYSFIVLTLHKEDNSASWKSFQAEHGTLDASTI